MPVYYRVDVRRSEADAWEKRGKYRSVPEAREAARALEAAGSAARIRGPGGHVIAFQTIELGPQGRDLLAQLIEDHPEGRAPGVDVQDALRLLRGEKPSDDDA